ncbi:MAG: hypothetical protein IAG13_07065 [Deltaproteobacteria bacterium]|nr:hypothetical protein [Nannocystaceae bacterium]
MTELGSRSDLETLRRSGRGKFILLGVLLVGALGAAGYTFLHRGGTGNPEDPGKVLVVTRGTRVGFSVVLKDVGFEAAEGTLPAWVDKAKDEVPELDAEGVAAVMQLADRFGWGFVAFENPAEVDFSGLEIDERPTIDATTGWAVVSAGDFAFPHVMTVSPAPSKVLRDGSVPLLQALFAHEQLHVLQDPQSVPVERLQLRDRLEEGMHRLEQVPQAEQMAEKIVLKVREQLTDGERAEPKPSLIGEPLESGSSHPLPDGNLLTTSRTLDLVTRDAVRADLELGKQHRFVFGALGADPAGRVACTALAGGEREVGDLSSVLWSPDGSVALLDTLADGETLWRFDASQGACGWTRSHALAKPRPGLDGRALPWRTGDVARIGHVDGLGVVSVVSPDGTEQTLGMLESTRLSELVWLGDDHLAASAYYEVDGSSWIAVFSTEEPMKLLLIPAATVMGASSVGELAMVPGRNAFVLTASVSSERLYRLDLPAALPELFAAPPLAEGRTVLEAPGRPNVYQLDPSKFTATALTRKGTVAGVQISNDGKWAVYSTRGDETDPDADDDHEIAIAAVDGSGERLLTRNAVGDNHPYFTADGKHVVFETGVEMPKTGWTISAPRMVPTAP